MRHTEILIASNLIIIKKNLVDPKTAPDVFKWYFLTIEKGMCGTLRLKQNNIYAK